MRNYAKMSQTEFGNLFNCTRGMIDSYESGRVTPSTDLLRNIAAHFRISFDTIMDKDLQLNPGLIVAGGAINNGKNYEEIITAKDELIDSLRKEIERQSKIIDKLLSSKS